MKIMLVVSLWVWMKCEIYQGKMDTPDELLADILDATGCLEKRPDHLRQKKHAIFLHVLQSALRLTLGFSKIHCDLKFVV